MNRSIRHSEDRAGALIRLRIMATTDLHMHILPFDYFRGVPSEGIGLARTATLIKAARAEVRNAILVDNGDFLSGTPVSDHLASEAAWSGEERAAEHPLIAAMHALGYDAGALGNHDFDHGLAFTRAVVSQARFPLLCANAMSQRAVSPAEDALLFPPYALLERDVADETGLRHRLRIGVIGLLPPGSVPQYRSNPFPILTRDIVEAARGWVPLVRDAGADLVVVLAHSGIGAAAHHAGMENAVVPLTRIRGIDAIIAGHSHQVFPGPVPDEPGEINGVPVICPGFWGSHLGIIDFTLHREGGAWRVAGHETALRPVARREPAGRVRPLAEPDGVITRIMRPLHERTLARAEQPVGSTLAPLHSYFALVAPSSAVQFVQRAQAWFVRERLPEINREGLPILSSACPFKCGGLGGPGFFSEVPAGELTLLSIADLYPYPNDIGVIALTGTGLRDWLERAASIFNQVPPDSADVCLKDNETPCYLYETVLGLDYEIDLSQPARYTCEGFLRDANAARVVNIRHRGRPLDDSARFLLVTNSYRLGGGGRYPGIDASRTRRDLPVPVRDVLAEYARTHREIELRTVPHWRLRSAPGAHTGFRSSPMARRFLSEPGLEGVTPLAEDGEGFLRFRLAL